MTASNFDRFWFRISKFALNQLHALVQMSRDIAAKSLAPSSRSKVHAMSIKIEFYSCFCNDWEPRMTGLPHSLVYQLLFWQKSTLRFCSWCDCKWVSVCDAKCCQEYVSCFECLSVLQVWGGDSRWVHVPGAFCIFIYFHYFKLGSGNVINEPVFYWMQNRVLSLI